jgi:hypothetical protein
MAAAVAALAMILSAHAQDRTYPDGPPPGTNAWMRTWIPVACCVTNNCCWEISPTEVRSIGDDQWEVVSTGQVRPRTDWSPDGKFYRCACDLTEGKWIRHQGANTRCLFVPMRMVGIN